MHPDDLLDQLKKTATPRKQKTLDLIHEVCREQYERGSRDFSVATIARIAADRGGPSKGAIHNKTGDDYKGLIKAWAEHTGGVTRKVRQVSENPYAALIDKAGTLRAKGLVNSREQLESLFTAKELGVASVQEFIDHQHA